jgi:hypothetical protein
VGILQLLLAFRWAVFTEEMIKSFSFLCRHFYTSRMKPESKSSMLNDALFSHCICINRICLHSNSCLVKTSH